MSVSVGRRGRELSILILIFAWGFLTACSSTVEEPARPPKGPEMIIVSDMLNPPFSSWDEEDETRPVGVEVEIVARLAAEMGYGVRWEERPFAELMPAVSSGTADIACSTLGITEERAKKVLFSRPYFVTQIAVVVRAGQGEPSSLAELTHARVGAGKGTTSESAVQKSLPEATLVVEAKEGSTLNRMLEEGELDAVVMDRPAADRFVAESAASLRVLSEPLAEEKYGFVFHPESRHMQARMDRIIERLEANGWLDRYYQEHGLR